MAIATRRAERAIPNGSPRAQIDGAYAAIGGLFQRRPVDGIRQPALTSTANGTPICGSPAPSAPELMSPRAPDHAAPIRVGLLRHAGPGGCSSAGHCNWR